MDIVDEVRHSLHCFPVGLVFQDVVIRLGVLVGPRPLDPLTGLQYLDYNSNSYYTHHNILKGNKGPGWI